ncbi:GNAT family N-acetyltransferase [Streptomyces althioticus]|uniref:GNAT family N-acetyltransferase n=1 Tax=Streptomyces althioticus TaxID=83380 RepID=UPI0036BEF728
MRIRAFTPQDLTALTDLTIETFRPFYEESFRPLVGETVFANQHGDWRDDYRREVPGLHAPERHLYVAVAEADDGDGDGDGDGDSLAGYVAWSVDPGRRNGSISHLAVSAQHRRGHLGTALCKHAFAHMRSLGAEVVEIGTGGDPFHAPARALYERLGCTALPTAVYYRQL